MKAEYIVELKGGIRVVDVFKVIDGFAVSLGSVLRINLRKRFGKNPLEVLLEEPSKFYSAVVDILQGEYTAEMMASLLAKELSRIIGKHVDYRYLLNALKNDDRDYLRRVLIVEEK